PARAFAWAYLETNKAWHRHMDACSARREAAVEGRRDEMTLAELREARQHRIAEVTNTYLEPQMWRAWLKQAQYEIARETKIIQRRAITTTVPGQQSYPIDPDFFMVNVVRFGNHPVLKPITPYELESRPLDQGIPTHYLVVGRELLLWPTPSTAEELVAWYYATPEDMVQDGDEPEIPRVYHPSLIPGACYRAPLCTRPRGGAAAGRGALSRGGRARGAAGDRSAARLGRLGAERRAHGARAHRHAAQPTGAPCRSGHRRTAARTLSCIDGVI